MDFQIEEEHCYIGVDLKRNSGFIQTMALSSISISNNNSMLTKFLSDIIEKESRKTSSQLMRQFGNKPTVRSNLSGRKRR